MTILDAAAIAREVSAGRLDPVEAVEPFIARTEARNGALNAVLGFDAAQVRARAEAVRARLARGEALPLAGVPVVVKDNIWGAGVPVTQGSRLFAEFVPPRPAHAVRRLEAAGAVILGRGACSEFAAKGVTTTPLHGATRHPLDPALTPGGSSGGNAVALAAGFAPLALGTDAGGSSRRPAAHCGVVGFKPSYGAIPYNVGFQEPFHRISCMAPMARTVEDASLLFETLAEPDSWVDPDSIAVAPEDGTDPRGWRIGYSPDFGLDVPVDADVEAAVGRAVAALGDAGFKAIRRHDPMWPWDMDRWPSREPGEAALMPLQAAGLAALHGERWLTEPELFDPDIGAQIERGLALTGVEVATALLCSDRLRTDTLWEGLQPWDLDLLIGPTTPCVAWPLDRLGPETIGGVPASPRAHAAFTPLWNHALVPALSIPCGRGRDGLPVGLQIVGPRGSDRRVLAAGRAMERALEGLTA